MSAECITPPVICMPSTVNCDLFRAPCAPVHALCILCNGKCRKEDGIRPMRNAPRVLRRASWNLSPGIRKLLRVPCDLHFA